MYKVSLHDQFTSAVKEPEYRELVNRSEDATLFNDWPWLSVWVKHCLAEQQLHLVVRDADDSLVGYVALQMNREHLHGVPARIARFIQYPWGDRVAILLDRQHLEAWPVLLEHLRQLSGERWDCMIWNEWFDTQELRQQAHEYAHNTGFVFYSRLTSQCPVLELGDTTEEQMVASYSSKLRSDLKRRKKKLAKLGGVIEHLRPDQTQVDGLVEKMKFTEAQSWKGDEGVGIFNDRQGADFFTEVSRALAANDQLDLALIWIDGELASYKYGFFFRDTFLDYSIGYLPQYGKLGLGRILLDELVLAGIREGYRAVDASRVGAVSKHLLFERTDKTVEHHRAYWFANGVKGRVLQVLVIFAKPFMKELRDRYRAWQRSRGKAQGKAEK